MGVCVWARVSAAPRHSWLGCWGVRVCVLAPPVPRHFWPGCAAWVCVFGLGFRLRPATPGCAVGVCVFVCLLPLYPATPGWGVRWGCVCLGSGFGCTPPLVARVLGCVCAGVGAPLAPRHFWLGCAPWVCVFGLGFRLRPATPGWGVGLCVCWCGRSACTPPLLAGVRAVGVCVWAWVTAAPRHSWLGCCAVCVLVCALRLHPATPGWGARRGCVCLSSGFRCTPPLLAGVLGCVCAGVGAPLAPRHSWLGCTPWVCVFGLGFRLRPASPGWGVGLCVCWCACSSCSLASPGWGVRLGCVCLGSGFGCAPPLLAGVLGCVCARVRALLAPRHSWLGCAVWVCVFGLGFKLRPATPGWGVGVCVFVCLLPLYPATSGRAVRRGCVLLGSGFGCAPPLLAGVLGCACLCASPPCTPPLLAGVCARGVCVWARVSAAPRHPWLGCWAVCVLVWALRLHPATPGWGARRGRVCLGSGFGCAPPILAGVLGCVCAGVGAPLAPRHSWLGCALWVCVFGLGFRLRPATPGWGVGLCVCWCRRSACTPPLLAGVRAVGVCVWARVSAATRQFWLGCWAVCVLVWALRLHPATPGWGARCGCVCLGSGFGCAPPLLAGVLGCVCARVRAPLAPRHSWLGFAPWICVFGLGFRLRPATPGWGVGLCVCWCGRSACTPPLLAGVRAVGVCVWARVSAAPRHSWLGCWAVCVLVWALRLHPATPAWGARRGCVCLGSGFGCAPPLLAGVLSCVCAGVGAPLAPRHSWLGCAPWVCVFGLGFRRRPATPGWVVPLCVCWCGRSPCTPPLLAGVRAVGVCVWARVSAAPRHSWLGCCTVCLLVCALRLHPATPGWGARRGCVCLSSGFGCAPPHLAWVFGVCVCWCGRSACTPPLLAGMCAVGVCVSARVSAAPRHSWLGCWAVCVLVCVLLLFPCHFWLGCAVWVCVFGLDFQLRPATPGWGVGLCVCPCARSACTPPLLAGVRGVGVCVWARVSAAPRHSWLGCWGVRVCVPAPPVHRHFWLGCAVGVCVFGLGFGLHPATPGWGARRGCVCLRSGFGCAPPPLAGVLGCVCAGVGAPLAPRHSWLGCVPWVCVFGLGFRLRPATPGWGVGLCVCWCGRSACTPPLLAGVRAAGVCVCARVSAAPRHPWLGCWGVSVLVWALRLHPATPGWGARRGCVYLGSGFSCAPPLLAGVLGCVSAGVGAPLAPRHCWLGCAVWVCVFGLGFQLRPATPGWGVGVCVFVCLLPLYTATSGWGVRWGCVCLGSGLGCTRHSWLGCAPWVCMFALGFRLRPATPGWGVGVCLCWCGRSACTPPLLAGVRAVGVCVWAWVSAAPRHSWMRCWAVCVLVWALRLHPATPGWGARRGCVCLRSGFGCAPPPLAGVLGCVCAGVGAPLAPRHSWLGCAPWVWVFGLGFQLCPATPGWAVGVCVCWCGRSACTPPLLAGVCGVGVCVWARVSAAPSHSWLGCWGVCVLVCVLLLYPASPSWGVRLGCVCLGSGFGCGPPLLAGMLGCVCARVRAPLAPLIPKQCALKILFLSD